MESPKYKDKSCRSLVITSLVSSMCHGKQQCSLPADPVILAMFSGESLSKESVACHKNYSAIRTTSACVHQTIFINKFSTSSERPSTISTSASSIQPFIPLVTTEYFPTSRLSFNTSKSSEEIEAKPLEPKPSIIDVFKSDVNLVSSLTEVLYQSGTNNYNKKYFE